MPLASASRHDPNCSGCPSCREDYAAMLDETPAQAARRLRAESGARVPTVSAARHAERKTAAQWRDHFGRLLQGFGSIQPDAPPDPYRALADTALDLTPDLDPHYSPRGQAADGYGLAIAARRFREQDAEVGAPNISSDAHGVPDPYKAALAARRKR